MRYALVLGERDDSDNETRDLHDAALQQEKKVFLRPRTGLMVGEVPGIGQHGSAADDCTEECDP